MNKIIVQGIEINIDNHNVSLTNMVSKHAEGSKLIEKWLTNKNTIEFLGIWEQLNNTENFNSPEFGGIMNEAGTNRFYMSVKQWISRTNAIGISAKTGRDGGTYAHQDIAFNFALYISPVFNLMLIKEFQRLKEEEAKQLGGQWDARRWVTKVNYKIQTDAVKAVMIPFRNLPKDKEGIVYAEEADLIYKAMFGFTSKEWRKQFPELAEKGNIRDYANSHQLIVLANLESLNSALMNAGYKDINVRLEALRKQSIIELNTLKSSNELSNELVESTYLNQQKRLNEHKPNNQFNNYLSGLLNTPPPKKGGAGDKNEQK